MNKIHPHLLNHHLPNSAPCHSHSSDTSSCFPSGRAAAAAPSPTTHPGTTTIPVPLYHYFFFSFFPPSWSFLPPSFLFSSLISSRLRFARTVGGLLSRLSRRLARRTLIYSHIVRRSPVTALTISNCRENTEIPRLTGGQGTVSPLGVPTTPATDGSFSYLDRLELDAGSRLKKEPRETTTCPSTLPRLSASYPAPVANFREPGWHHVRNAYAREGFSTDG